MKKYINNFLMIGLIIFMTNCGSDSSDETDLQDEAVIYNSSFLTTSLDFETNRSIPQIDVFNTNAGLKDVRTGGTYMVPNDMNDTNSSWDILKVYFQDYKKNIEIVIIDGDTGAITKKDADGAAFNGMFHVIAPNGKLFLISGKADGTIEPQVNVYDPSTNIFSLSVVDIPTDMDGATYNAMQIGTDGSLFISGMHNVKGPHYHKPRILEINTTNYDIISDSGPIAVPAQPWKIAADDTYVYLLTGKVPWKVIQYQRAAPHASKVIASQNSGLNILQTAFGVVMEKKGGDVDHFFLYKDRIYDAPKSPSTWKNATPPWVYPSSYTPRDIWWTLNITHNSIDQFLKYPEVTPYGNMQKEGSVKIVVSNAEPLNGQAELWIQQPQENNFTKYSYTLNTHQTTLNRIIKRSDGKIMGVGGAYGPFMTYDTTTNAYEASAGSLGVSAYTMIESGGKVYISGYPRGVLFEYDYTKEWTQGIHDYVPGVAAKDLRDQSLNPRWCGKLAEHGSGAHKMYSSAKGADGLLYFGGQWMRDGNGGGLAWYNPQTDEMGGISKPFLNYAIQHLTAVDGGKYIALATVPVTSANGFKPQGSKLFLFNTQSKKIEKTLDPMAGIKGNITGQIIGVDAKHIVGFTKDPVTYSNTYIYKINIQTGKLDYRIKVDRQGFESNFAVGDTISINDEGEIITWLGWHLISFNHTTQEVTKLGIHKYGSRSGIQGDMAVVAGDVYVGRFNTLLKLTPQ